MILSPADVDPPPHRPYAMSDTTLRTLQARAETALSELRPGRLRGAEYSDIGYVGSFVTRDAARCAAVLLDDLIDHVTVFAMDGRFKVAGAWKREAGR